MFRRIFIPQVLRNVQFHVVREELFKNKYSIIKILGKNYQFDYFLAHFSLKLFHVSNIFVHDDTAWDTFLAAKQQNRIEKIFASPLFTQIQARLNTIIFLILDLRVYVSPEKSFVRISVYLVGLLPFRLLMGRS